MRSRLPASLALGLLAFQLLASGAHSQADAPPVTWWGPQGEDGWHARVPVVVQNPEQHAVKNMPVRWELNVAQLLGDAGWPTRQTGDRLSARGFTLDPESFRVVEYTNFNPPGRPGDGVPKTYDTLVEGADRFVVPSAFHRGALRAGAGAYDNATNPVGVLTWIAPGETQPNGPRYFYVYFDRQEAAGRAPAVTRDIDAGRLAGQHYVSRGTLLFGYGSIVNVTGTAPNTEVTIYTYTSSSRIQPHEPSTRSNVPNPFRISAGSSLQYSLAARPVPFVVMATQPVIAQAGAPGFVPSLDGGLAGTEFAFVATGFNLFLIGTGAPSTVVVTGNGITSPPIPLSASNPWAFTPSAPGALITARLVSGAPFLIQDAGSSPSPPVQFPSIFGAPAAHEALGAALSGGYFRITSPLGASAVRVWSTQRGTQIEPPGTPGDEFPPPRVLEQGAQWIRPFTTGPQGDPTTPIAYEAVRERAPVYVYGGGQGSAAIGIASAIGGRDARFFDVPYGGGYSAFAYHNDTLLQISVDGGAPTATTLNALNRLDFQAASRVVVQASKPIALLPRTNIGHLPGIVASLPFEVGTAEVRGAAISLKSLDSSSEPVLRGAGPGTTAVFRFTAQNLGRETGGSLTDTLRFSVVDATLPWDVTVEPEQATLRTGESATFEVLVDVPAGGTVGTDFRFAARAASSLNPKVADEVRALVVTRTIHEVALAFQDVGGPRSLTTSQQPGQPLQLVVAVTNRGSANDTFDLALRSTSSDFGLALGEQGLARNVTLPPGRTALLPLNVTTPLVTNSPLATIELSAQSRSSAAATDKLLLTVELREEGAIRVVPQALLGFAEPGGNATINVSIYNDGNLPANLAFTQTTVAPPGWKATRILYRDLPLSEINDLPPSQLHGPLNLTVQVPVPSNATAFASARVLFGVQQRDLEGRQTPVDSIEILALSRREMLFNVEGDTHATVPPGGRHELVYRLHNGGNGIENVTLSLTGLPAGWAPAPAAAQGIAPGAFATLRVPVEIPATSPPGTHAGSIEIRTQVEGVTSVPLQIVVPPTPKIGLIVPAAHRGPAGLAQTVFATLSNDGNVASPIHLKLDMPAGWTSPGLDDLELPIGATRILPIRFTPLANADGNFTVNLTATQEGVASSAQMAVATVTPTPRIGEILYAPNARDIQPGRDVLISVLVENPSTVDIPEVVLDLRFDGKVVDQVTIENLPAETNRIATLRATPTERVGTVEIVLDPQQRFVALGADDRVVQLTGGSVLPVPPAGLLAILAALVGTALLARRGRGR